MIPPSDSSCCFSLCLVPDLRGEERRGREGAEEVLDKITALPGVPRPLRVFKGSDESV